MYEQVTLSRYMTETVRVCCCCCCYYYW